MSIEKLKLKDNHTWKSKPGYSICVLDRGLVRFDYPSHWIVEPENGAVHLHDQPPSVESCDLGVSIFRVPGAGFLELSLEEMLLNSLDEERKPRRQSPVRRIERADLTVVWLEQKYRDEEYNRDATFRVALARGATLCLISMNYWTKRAATLEAVWDEVLRTLVMDMPVEDPTKGPAIQ